MDAKKPAEKNPCGRKMQNEKGNALRIKQYEERFVVRCADILIGDSDDIEPILIYSICVHIVLIFI